MFIEWCAISPSSSVRSGIWHMSLLRSLGEMALNNYKQAAPTELRTAYRIYKHPHTAEGECDENPNVWLSLRYTRGGKKLPNLSKDFRQSSLFPARRKATRCSAHRRRVCLWNEG